METAETAEQLVLPLLSSSLYNELKAIAAASQCIISQTLISAHEAIRNGYTNPENAHAVPISDYCRMLTIRVNEGDIEMSFLPKGRTPVYTNAGKWSYEGRQTAKPAKTVGALLECMSRTETFEQIKLNNKWCNFDPETGLVTVLKKDTVEYSVIDDEAQLAQIPRRKQDVVLKRYGDKAYEEFANNLKAFYDSDIKFELVQGEQIRHYYNSSTYFKGKGGRGTLWESCMRNMPGYVFDLYASSPNCHLLVALKDGGVVARALVWNTNIGMIMDRVYYYEDFYFNRLIDYAKEEGWAYKAEANSAERSDIMTHKGEGEYERIKMPKVYIENLTAGPDHFPYMDTFKLYDIVGKTLHNDWKATWSHRLESAHGSYSGRFTDYDGQEFCDLSQSYHSAHVMVDVYHLEGDVQGRAHSHYTCNDYNGQRIAESGSVRLIGSQRRASPHDPNVVRLMSNSYTLRESAIQNADGTWRQRTDADNTPSTQTETIQSAVSPESDPLTINIADTGAYTITPTGFNVTYNVAPTNYEFTTFEVNVPQDEVARPRQSPAPDPTSYPAEPVTGHSTLSGHGTLSERALERPIPVGDTIMERMRNYWGDTFVPSRPARVSEGLPTDPPARGRRSAHIMWDGVGTLTRNTHATLTARDPFNTPPGQTLMRMGVDPGYTDVYTRPQYYQREIGTTGVLDRYRRYTEQLRNYNLAIGDITYNTPPTTSPDRVDAMIEALVRAGETLTGAENTAAITQPIPGTSNDVSLNDF